MHEPVMGLLPIVGLATTVGVGALIRMKVLARSASSAHERATERDTDERALAGGEELSK